MRAICDLLIVVCWICCASLLLESSEADCYDAAKELFALCLSQDSRWPRQDFNQVHLNRHLEHCRYLNKVAYICCWQRVTTKGRQCKEQLAQLQQWVLIDLSKKLSHYRPGQTEGCRRLRLPEFLDSWHMRMARLLAVHTGHLYHSGGTPGTHLC